MAVMSLLDLVEHLLNDGDAAHEFRSHPQQFLADHGLHDLSGHDVVDALKLGFDSVHPHLAQRIVLPDEAHHHAAAADALGHLLDAAPAESVLHDTHAEGAHDFGLGHDTHLAHDVTFGAGHHDTEHHDVGHHAHDVAHLTHLALDLGHHVADAGLGHDLVTSALDDGFGHGAHHDAHHDATDHLHQVDDVHHVDDHPHDLGHGPH